MAYEVLARKWRPQQFDDVVGQPHVTRTLCNAISAKRIAHAYLFVGPRGIGKTSIARIFAKALNCAKGPTPTPCGVCDACTEIMAGAALDVIEIDGASNNGVDQVRELRESARFMPARGPFKIYIIDEVHMLSAGAFNALLKTLEEPPPHVKFIFATTESQKLPATIVSRCQRFDLRRIPLRDIMGHLAKIAKAEGIEASEDALLAIARGAEGGMRDAESALDQLISFRGKVIGEDDVLSVFGLVSRKRLEDLADAVLRGDMAAIITAVGELDANGKNLGRVLVEMIEHLRNVLIARSAGGTGALDVSEAQAAILAGQASRTDEARLLRMIEILMDSEGRVRHSLSPRTLLETTLLRCARAATVVSVDVLIQRLNECKAMLAGAPDGGTGPAPDRAATPAPSRPGPPASSAPRPYTPPSSPAAPEADGAPRVRESGTSTPPAGNIATVWTSALAVIAAAKPRLRADLRDTRILSIAGNRVVVGIDREFSERLPLLDTPAVRETLAKVLSRALQRPVTVAFELADTPAGPTTTLPARTARATRPPATEPPDAPTSAGTDDADKRKARKKLIEDPAVESLMKTFGGRITDIRE